jgi:rod shape-determining protein MreC
MKLFRNKLTVSIALLSVGFLILLGYSVNRENRSFVENGVGVVFNGVQEKLYGFNDNVKGMLSFFFSFSEVKKENETLRKRNSELEGKALQFDSVKAENERLRDMLAFKDRNSFYEYIGCHIINKGGQGILDQYTIDKGSKDGVVKGRIVITSEGLVGQVTSVNTDWSIVQTLGSENIAVAAMVQNTKDSTGIVKGFKDRNNKLLAKLDNLPQDSEIKKDDVITTSGEGYIYPKGIRIGKVIEVGEDKAKVMKNAVIEPYVDFNKLEELFIIVPKDKNSSKYQGEEIR